MSTVNDFTNSDAEFDAFIKKVAKEREDNANNFSSGGGNPRDYEQPVYVGLETGSMKALRIVSGPPAAFGLQNSAGRAVESHISEIKDDAGKWFRLRLPPQEDRPEKDHVLWRMISKISEFKWEDKKRVSKYMEQYPELYNRIMKGGWDEGTNQHKYSKGWAGQKKLLINVIDRQDMDWHNEHKHTKILSKNIAYSEKDGVTTAWPEIGVPSFGFIDRLSGVVANYGPWVNYDIGVTRTGEKTSPYNIYNASACVAGGLKEIPENVYPLVKQGPLTDEEKAWEVYDLQKLFGPTSATSILKHLTKTIKEFDSIFGTDYYDTLKVASEKEKEEWAKEYGDDKEDSPAPAKAEVVQETTEPVARVTRQIPEEMSKTSLSVEKITALKGWGQLPKEHQDLIADVTVNAKGEVSDIVYTEDKSCVDCPECGVGSPTEFLTCPGCGVGFEG